MAKSNEVSFEWRSDFVVTFLERDLKQWIGFSDVTMRRLWKMLAHNNGQTVNYSSLGKSLTMSNVTIKNYIDLLESTFMIYVLPPYYSNLGKRLIKAPKVFISDSGITSALLGLDSFDELFAHPTFGAIWEQVVLTNLKNNYPKAEFFYYRTSSGSEIDIVMEYQNKVYAIECKATKSPKLSKGTYFAIDDIKPVKTIVVSPVDKGWEMDKNIEVKNLSEIIQGL
jgi:predicted AAA+ superfamily ATPase